MEDWCNYSDLPSPTWWERVEIKDKLDKCVRIELQEQAHLIIDNSSEEELENLKELLIGNKFSDVISNNVCIELDFMASKIKYFNKVSDDLLGDFGVSFDLIPELISKWRDEKVDVILKDSN